jgi:hypothetical protein
VVGSTVGTPPRRLVGIRLRAEGRVVLMSCKRAGDRLCEVGLTILPEQGVEPTRLPQVSQNRHGPHSLEDQDVYTT